MGSSQECRTLPKLRETQEVIVKNFRDGFFPFEGTQIKNSFEQLSKNFRRTKGNIARLIFTHNRKDAHQDHRLIAELTGIRLGTTRYSSTKSRNTKETWANPTYSYRLINNFIRKRSVPSCTLLIPNAQNPGSRRKRSWLLCACGARSALLPSGYEEAFYCRKLVL
jgi:hypothetical protein